MHVNQLPETLILVEHLSLDTLRVHTRLKTDSRSSAMTEGPNDALVSIEKDRWMTLTYTRGLYSCCY